MGCRQSKRRGCGKLASRHRYYDDLDCYPPRPTPCSPSACHIDGRYREHDLLYGGRRYRDSIRSRCYGSRMPSDHSICLCPPVPVASSYSRRRFHPLTPDVCTPSNCTRSRERGCFNNEYGYLRRASLGGRGCQRDYYPPPYHPRNYNLYNNHPLGARFDPLKPCPGQSSYHLPLNKNCDDYYSPRILRYTPSGAIIGAGGKRMNVAIHTHVDYDYDADGVRKKGCLKTPGLKPPYHKTAILPPGHPYASRYRQSARGPLLSCDSSDSRDASYDSHCLE